MKGSRMACTSSMVEKTPQEIIDAAAMWKRRTGFIEETRKEMIDAEYLEEGSFPASDFAVTIYPGEETNEMCGIVEKTPQEINDAAAYLEEGSFSRQYVMVTLGYSNETPEEIIVAEKFRDFKRIVVDGRSTNACNIFKVPNYIRSCDGKAYEPTIVGIGLFHYRKGQQLSPVLHSLKIQCVHYLVARHDKLDNVTELLRAEMKSLETQVRCCYSEDGENGYAGEEFADMMLRDGCFILFNLLKDGEEGKSKETNTMEENYLLELHEWKEEIIQAPLLHGMLWTWKLVVYDLLKLENQIPFFVVQRLFDLLKTPADEGIDLVQLALELFGTINPMKAKTFVTMPSSQVHHLLHLYHSSLIPSKLITPDDGKIMLEAPDLITLADEKSVSRMGAGLAVNLRQLVARGLGSKSLLTLSKKKEKKNVSEKKPDWIPSATELQEAGIKFRPMKAAESFLDVSFNNGVMEIPPLVVDDSTTSVFRNLIGFEQCYPGTRTHVTVYAAFMDCIINTTKDVNLLKRNGILSNRLGTEQAAADLFNKLCDQINFASDRNYLWEMFTEVTKYYESPWHKSRAELVRNYFNNPWAAISVVAAVVLLLLTIEQALFAAVSYFHPLH